MGFFSNLFNGGSAKLESNYPIENIPVGSITLDRVGKKPKQRRIGGGKENASVGTNGKKKKGWRNNKKKRKTNKKNQKSNGGRPSITSSVTSAPKLSIFLQQSEDQLQDDDTLNHTVDTGSLTASLTTNSILSKGESDNNRPDTREYCRPLTPAGVAQPPLHQSFPIDGVSESGEADSGESDSGSDSEEEEIERSISLQKQLIAEKLKLARSLSEKYAGETSDSTVSSKSDEDASSPLHRPLFAKGVSDIDLAELSPPLYHKKSPRGKSRDSNTPSLDSSSLSSENDSQESDKADANDPISEALFTEGLGNIIDSADEDVDDDSAIADLQLLNFGSTSTDIEELLAPIKLDFDSNEDELDLGSFSSEADSDYAVDNGSSDNNSANGDLLWQDLSNILEDLTLPSTMEFDLSLLKQNQAESKKLKEVTPKAEVKAEVKAEAVEIKTEVETTDVQVKIAKELDLEESFDSFDQFIKEVETETKEVKAEPKEVKAETKEVKAETKEVKTEVQAVEEFDIMKTFDQIVNEVEATIAKSQEENGWIANGLLETIRDDSSASQNSEVSFTSDDFNEDYDDAFHESFTDPMASSLKITTILEEEHDSEEDDDSVDPIDTSKSTELETINQEEKESKDPTSTVIDITPSPLPEEDETEDHSEKDMEREPSSDRISTVQSSLSSRSLTQPASSSNSFHSDEFREDDAVEAVTVNAIFKITTVTEGNENISQELSNPAMEDSLLEANEPKIEDLKVDTKIYPEPTSIMTEYSPPKPPTSRTPYPSPVGHESSSSPPSDLLSKSLPKPQLRKAKSALLSKSLPRPQLKKSVSWKDETNLTDLTEVCTYLPKNAQDLQKARDLVATYARIMQSLEGKRPSTVESTLTEDAGSVAASTSASSSSSSADLSEASSSIESLLSALSQGSAASQESVQVALEQIKKETERMIEQNLCERERARAEIIGNVLPELIDINTSSSSIESLMSMISNSSLSSNESMKKVVRKLKTAAEQRVLFSAQQLEAEKLKMLESQSTDSANTSVSSSTMSSIASSLSSTGTSDSVKYLMQKLHDERSRQSHFASTRDLHTLLHDDNQRQQAHGQILGNSWIDDCGSSSSLSSLLSSSPNSSASSSESSESVQYMMNRLNAEKERHKQRRKRLRGVSQFIESVCCIPTTAQIYEGRYRR